MDQIEHGFIVDSKGIEALPFNGVALGWSANRRAPG